MSRLLAVFTTVATIEEARTMARAIVERRLAACVQFHPIESVYEWQGSVHDEAEVRMLFKTTGSRRAALEAAIRELHCYELPAIFSLPMQHVHPPFAEWVEAGCAEALR